MLTISYVASAQENPPAPVVITKTGDISFGAFTVGSGGGTVTVNSSSVRSSSGDIVLLNLSGYSYSAATFEVAVLPDMVCSILFSTSTLTGPGASTLSLTINSYSPNPFITTKEYPNTTTLYVGGTLTVGGGATPGSYSGSFDITINQE